MLSGTVSNASFSAFRPTVFGVLAVFIGCESRGTAQELQRFAFNNTRDHLSTATTTTGSAPPGQLAATGKRPANPLHLHPFGLSLSP